MINIPKNISIIYFILLGVTLGSVIFAGAFVAPTIFHAEELLKGDIINRFQEGLIMTSIFVKLSYLVNITIVAVIFYEGYRFKSFERDSIALLSAVTVVLSGMLYSFYYIPQILEMQSRGEKITQSKIFENTHFASELDFKLFSFALLLLIIRNLYRSVK